MPALLPPPMPRLPCWITRTSGKRSRTSSTLPSDDPLSTRIVSKSRTESRHCSSQGRALYETTTTETSSRIGHRRAPHALPQQHDDARQREHQRQHEEEEAARKRGVCVDAEL